MGSIMNIALGVIILAGFAAFGATLFAQAAENSAANGGINASTSQYPVFAQSSALLNSSQNFTSDFTQSLQQSQQADPSAPVGSEWTLAGSAVVKSLLYVFNSLGFLFNAVMAAFDVLGTAFGVPGWVVATIIAGLSLVFGLAMMAAIMRYPI